MTATITVHRKMSSGRLWRPRLKRQPRQECLGIYKTDRSVRSEVSVSFLYKYVAKPAGDKENEIMKIKGMGHRLDPFIV